MRPSRFSIRDLRRVTIAPVLAASRSSFTRARLLEDTVISIPVTGTSPWKIRSCGWAGQSDGKPSCEPRQPSKSVSTATTHMSNPGDRFGAFAAPFHAGYHDAAARAPPEARPIGWQRNHQDKSERAEQETEEEPADDAAVAACGDERASDGANDPKADQLCGIYRWHGSLRDAGGRTNRSGLNAFLHSPSTRSRLAGELRFPG
jgi:hypothetical protein